MKKILKFSLFVFVIFYSCAECRADPLTLSGSLALQLDTSLNDRREELATSWDDFIQIQMIKNGSSAKDGFTIKTLNSFALVPGSPVIENRPGIPREFVGYRVFLTSREETTLRKERGRCMIFVKLSGTPDGRTRILSPFVPEERAQHILNQFPDFDPTKQPVAFDDVFIYKNRKAIKGDALDGLIRRLEKSPPFDPANPHATPPPGPSVGGWIAGAVVIAFGLFLYFFKNRQIKKTNYIILYSTSRI